MSAVLQERQTSGGGSSVSSVALAFSSNLTAGSALHVVGGQANAVSPAYTFSDNNGGSYTALDSPTWDSANSWGQAHAYSANHAAGATTVTLTFNASETFVALWIREIGGVTATPIDGHNNVNAASGTSASASATNSNQPALWSAVAVQTPNTAALSAGTGTQDIAGWNYTGATNYGLSSHSRVTTAGSQTATFNTATAGKISISLAIFDEAGGGSNAALAGPSAAKAVATATASVANALSGQSAARAASTAVLAVATALSGTMSARASAAGTAGIGIALSGISSARGDALGGISISNALSGICGASASLVAAVSNQLALLGSMGAVASWTASLASGSAAALSGIGGARASATGTLSVSLALAGQSGATASLQAPLGNAVQLNGIAAAVAGLSGSLTINSAFALSGISGAAASATGTLANAIALAGKSAAAAAMQAPLGNQVQLTGISGAVSNITGTLGISSGLALSGISSAAASATGALTNIAALTGASISSAANQGGMAVSIQLAGVSATKAFAGGALNGGAAAPLAGGPRYIVKRISLRPFTVSRLIGRRLTVTSMLGQFRLDTKLPDELLVLTFDFTPDLLSTENLSGTPTVDSLIVDAGTDPSPMNILNGAPQIDSSLKKVLLPVQSGVDLCDYGITVRCPTTNPLKVLGLRGTLPVRAKPY
ncbi:MAG: hypothetical protein JSR67_03735 [Proteobacteria bacterium]|nr:hypothetical protein [Pseudomonadota bacterium]